VNYSNFSRGWLPKWKRGYPVTVAELQQLLSHLGEFLRASESAKLAGELEYISAKLAPFRAYKLKAFADLLEQAEAHARGECKPKKAPGGGAKKDKADPAGIDQACQRVLQLYANAIDPTVTLEQIEAAVQALEALDPPKPRLDDLAKQVGFTQKFRSKAEVLKAVRQKIIGRKGAFERPNA
jgi:hypothetical protein